MFGIGISLGSDDVVWQAGRIGKTAPSFRAMTYTARRCGDEALRLASVPIYDRDVTSCFRFTVSCRVVAIVSAASALPRARSVNA